MKQTKLESAVEVGINLFIGYWLAILTQIVVFSMKGIETTGFDNMEIAFYFTIVSLVRSYVIRRWFNHYLGVVNNKIVWILNEANYRFVIWAM